MKFEVRLTRQDDDSQSSPPSKCVGETGSLQTIHPLGSESGTGPLRDDFGRRYRGFPSNGSTLSLVA